MRVTRILAPAVALVLAVSVEARAMPPEVSPGIQSALQAPATLALSASQEQAQPPPKADVNVDVTTERVVWYLDPVWIIVGLIAAAIVIALIIAASRSSSGTTTVVK
ncbi:MAG: hypothetical protein ACT4P7_06960 [Gemmatimonadaceae bacterium]